MGVNGTFAKITRADILAVAEPYGLRLQVRPIIEKVSAALDLWPKFADAAGVTMSERKKIAKDIATFSSLIKP